MGSFTLAPTHRFWLFLSHRLHGFDGGQQVLPIGQRAGERVTDAVWSYEQPYLEGELLRDRICFDAARFDELVDEEQQSAPR